jgi:phage terminase large subunit-like protein
MDPAQLRYAWRFWARKTQLEPPGDWSIWLYLAGRGAGKTRSAAEWVREHVETGRARRIGIICEDAADCRDVAVEGECGLLAISPKESRPTYEPSKRRLSWRNGAVATLYSAADYDVLRGPSHDLLWMDELAKWPYAQQAFDNAMMGLRLGKRPRCLITTTPRNIPVIRQLLTDPKVVVVRDTTFANASNLPPAFLNSILGKYQNTRLGRQELLAEVLTDTPGALWRAADIEKTRISPDKIPPMRRIVVAIDPAMATSEGACETGLIVAGVGELDSRGYVLHDASGKYTPDGWARQAVALFDQFKADRLVCEGNLPCSEICRNTLETVRKNLPLKLVHARTGKRARAEPVAALYEQGRVSHCGLLEALEDQLTSWDASTSSESPDRLDALVHALTELMLGSQVDTRIFTREQAAKVLELPLAEKKRRQILGGTLYRA